MIFYKTILIILSPINTKAKIKRDACSFLTGFIVIVFWTMIFVENKKL